MFTTRKRVHSYFVHELDIIGKTFDGKHIAIIGETDRGDYTSKELGILEDDYGVPFFFDYQEAIDYGERIIKENGI